MFVSIACCFLLVCQVVNLIASAIDTERSALSVIIVTLILEVLSAVLILYLFSPLSEFLRSAGQLKHYASHVYRSRQGERVCDFGQCENELPRWEQDRCGD